MKMLQTMIKVANTHELSLQQMCIYFNHPIFRDNQMQNIWSKAYFYQLNQPKAPHPQIINVGWPILGKNNIAVGGKGEVTLLQYILHLIVDILKTTF